jgi:glycosyltransferase involved in cell wall biosynthesis
MSKPIIIATVLRKTGETGVHTHFQTWSSWLANTGRGAPKLVTPYDRNKWLVYPVFAVRRLIAPLSGSFGLWWYRYWHQLCLYLNLRALLADGRACVIYAQCPMSAQAAIAARRSAAQRVAMIAHFNISEADEWAGKGVIARAGRVFQHIRAYEARVVPRVDRLVFVSTFVQRNIYQRIPGTTVIPGRVIPNFISARQVDESKRTVTSDLICIGTLERRKNQHYAIEIAAAARQIGHPLRLTLVGDGPDRSALIKSAHALGVGDDVVFTGHVDDVAGLMAKHHACLHVPHMESFGIVLIEAMSQGLPIFASRVGGIPEVFNDGIEGRFIPLDNPVIAAMIIQQWLLQPSRLREAGEHARARFANRFETGTVAQELADFLTQDLTEPRNVTDRAADELVDTSAPAIEKHLVR